MPDIYQALPVIHKFGGIPKVRKAILDGKIQGRRDFHALVNAIGMGTCYAPGANADQIDILEQTIRNMLHVKANLQEDIAVLEICEQMPEAITKTFLNDFKKNAKSAFIRDNSY